MSIWEKMGLVVPEEVDTRQAKAKSATASPVQPALSVVATQPVATQMVNLTSTVVVINDSEYCEMLNGKLNDAAQEATSFDFMKFIATTNAIASTIPDEATRFKVAFATNQVSNKITIESLESSADQYVGIINNIDLEFKKWAANFVASEIDARSNQIKQITQTKESKIAEISKITAEIAELSVKENEINVEMQAKSAILENKNVAFASARVKIEGNLVSLKNNLRKYLS